MIKEVCIAVRTSKSGRTQPGDILVVREPLGGIGLGEGKDFLWLLIEESQLPTPPIRSDVALNLPHKHRYQVPLAALKVMIPDLDLARLADKDDFYQPCLDTDPVTGVHRRQHPVPAALKADTIDKEL